MDVFCHITCIEIPALSPGIYDILEIFQIIGTDGLKTLAVKL